MNKMNILFQPRFENPVLDGTKIHTIRADYDYWERYDGKECSFRIWTGKPYRSPQREFFRGFIRVRKIRVSSVVYLGTRKDGTKVVVPGNRFLSFGSGY